MAINPIAFARAVNEQFLRYQLTAFPLADEALVRQAEESIRGGGARPRPLIKGPKERYRKKGTGLHLGAKCVNSWKSVSNSWP